MGKKCEPAPQQQQSNLQPLLMVMMMMQMMEKTNNVKGLLDRIVDRLEGRGLYSPGMQNYLGNVLNGMPSVPGQPPYGAFMLPPATYAAMSPNLPLRSFLNGTVI